MLKIRWRAWAGIMALVVLILTGCGSVVQPNAEAAIEAAPAIGKENFLERQMINRIEWITDQPGGIYFVYFLGPDGVSPLQLACIGRPTSSTESLEPNDAQYAYKHSDGDYTFRPFLFPLGENADGVEVMAGTTEQAGRDGTYGEPVDFRQCATPTNGYRDFPAGQGAYLPIVSNEPLSFNNGIQEINREMLAKQLIAEKALMDGKCVDANLDVTECPRIIPTPVPSGNPAPAVTPTTVPIQP